MWQIAHPGTLQQPEENVAIRDNYVGGSNRGGPELGLGIVIVRCFGLPKCFALGLGKLVSMALKIKIKSKWRSSKAEGVARPRCVDEAPKPLFCSYCARPAEKDSRGGPWRFEVKRHATRESRLDMLNTNDGENWWMRAQGPGEWIRPCWWWTDVRVDGEENGWSILLHQCGRCGAKERIMADACSTIADKRAEWGRAHPEDDKAEVCCICSYCGEHIKESSTGLLPYRKVWMMEESLDYNRGVWWMAAHGHGTWRRCYGWHVESAYAPGSRRMVHLKRCHRCNEGEQVLHDTCTRASDSDSDDWGQQS